MNTLIENSSPVFSVKKYLKKFDLTGVKYHPRIFKQKKYVSIPGSIITIISFAILIYRIIISIESMLNKKNFQVSTERETELNENFTVSNLSLQVCLMSTKFFSREGVFTNYYIEIKGEKTTKEIIKGYDINCYYYDFNGSTFLTNDDFFNNLKSYIAYFSVPANVSYYDVLLFYNITYINPNDYVHPIKVKQETIILGALEANAKDVVFHMDKIRVIHKNKLFSLFYESINLKEENYSSLSSYTISPDTGRYYDLRINIEYSGWTTTYEFIGYDFEEELSSIGGLISIISIIQRFFGRFINKLFLNWEIKEYTQYSEISYNALISNSKIYKKLGFKGLSETQIKQVDKNNKFNENTELNLKDEKINTFEMNNNIINKNIINPNNTIVVKNNFEKSLTDNLLVGKNNNLLINKNSLNNQNKLFPGGRILNLIDKNSSLYKSNNNKTIIEESNLNILNPNNKKSSTQTISLVKNKIYSEYKQFNKILDYYIIYQTIKDVNLLKLLCLNQNNAQLFYKYRYKNINISVLDNLMEKEIKNFNLNEGVSFFDNVYEKINVLNSFH